MNSKLAMVVFAALFMFGLASAMSVTAKTMPPVLAPGGTGKLIITIQPAGPASGVEFKIGDTQQISIEREGLWTYLGDTDGTPLTYVLNISIPQDTKPGTYAIPITVEYEDTTGKMRTEYTYIFIVVSGGGITIQMPDHVYGGKIQKIPVTIENKGSAITNAYIIYPGALGSAEKYVGIIPAEDNITATFTAIPICKNGIYEANIIVRGFTDSNVINISIPYVMRCYPPRNGLSVYMNMPETVSGAEYNTTLRITNNLDVAIGPLTITITGKNVDIGGQTGYSFAAIQPHQTVEIPIRWKLQQEDAPGAIVVNVYEGNYPRTYIFSTIPSTTPQVKVYLNGEPKWVDGTVQISVTVANVGTGTASTVYLSAEGNNIVQGNAVIGDLAPGDYDSATISFKPAGRETTIKTVITYFQGGSKREIVRTFTIQTPPKPQPVGLWIVAAIVVVGALWWWRKRK